MTLPKDEDAVLDLYIDAGCGAADPYWAALWPSAVALASALLAQPQLVAGRRVCDVGAGLGLGGLGAALAGAAEVRACVGFGEGVWGRVGESVFLPTTTRALLECSDWLKILAAECLSLDSSRTR